VQISFLFINFVNYFNEVFVKATGVKFYVIMAIEIKIFIY